MVGTLLAFSWGAAASSGILLGALLGLTTRLPHRAIAAIMSFGAGVLLSVASAEVASDALTSAGAVSTAAGFLAGAATFSVLNALLAGAWNRKRCGECARQPSEADVPGSGMSIALGTALDAVPEALILGVTLGAGPPDLSLVAALALSNLPEALSGTAGMRLASRSVAYVLRLWSGIALGSAATTALAFLLLGDLDSGAAATLRAYGAGALVAMAAETLIPEAFHNGPRYSGVLAALGFAALNLLSGLA